MSLRTQLHVLMNEVSLLMTNSYMYFISVEMFEETSWSKEVNDHLFELCR